MIIFSVNQLIHRFKYMTPVMEVYSNLSRQETRVRVAKRDDNQQISYSCTMPLVPVSSDRSQNGRCIPLSRSLLGCYVDHSWVLYFAFAFSHASLVVIEVLYGGIHITGDYNAGWIIRHVAYVRPSHGLFARIEIRQTKITWVAHTHKLVSD
jgi:hypothetical protein